MKRIVRASTTPGWITTGARTEARRHEPSRGALGYPVNVGVLLLAVSAACARGDAATQSFATDLAASGSAVTSPSPLPQSSMARVEVPVSLERSCREICDRSRRLNCENVAKCMPNCLAMGSLTPCTDTITTLYQCLVGQPVQNWRCAPDGVAAIQAGFCDKEQGEAVACMEAKMR